MNRVKKNYPPDHYYRRFTIKEYSFLRRVEPQGRERMYAPPAVGLTILFAEGKTGGKSQCRRLEINIVDDVQFRFPVNGKI